MIYLMLCCRLIYKMNVEVCSICYILVEICCLILKSNVYFYNKKNIRIILRWIKMNVFMNIKENCFLF